MTRPVKTLVTNDDGITSPGLFRLAVMAMELGLDVVVAAPASEASGSSASIIASESDGRIRMDRRKLEGLEEVPTYAVHGAPALIALIAGHGTFGDPPELVLSGINRGANVGRAIIHSGTVGAALTGGVNGGRGLAVSLDVGLEPTRFRWSTAATMARKLIPFLLDQPEGTVLNLNVPNLQSEELPEFRQAPLARFGIVQTTMTESDQHSIRLAVADQDTQGEPGSDAALLADGFATVTSIDPVREAALPAL